MMHEFTYRCKTKGYIADAKKKKKMGKKNPF